MVVGAILTNSGSTSTRPTNFQGIDPTMFNPIENTCKASEVSHEIPMGAVGTRFLQ